MSFSVRALFAGVFLLLMSSAMAAPLTVGVKASPPFSFQSGDRWDGISVELWENVAERSGVEYRYRVYPSVSDMLVAVEQGQIDLALGAVSVTADRERRMDFSQPMYRGGLGIMTRSEPGGWLVTLQNLFSWKFFSAVLALVIVLLIVGVLIWLFERKRNPEQFGGSMSEGIGSGFWWSAVTMTTVGYGDKAPVSKAGRLLGLVWMFVSIITISGFTAAIASSVTVNQLQTRIKGAADLPRVNVASVENTSGAQWLAAQGIQYKPYKNLEQAMRAVALGEEDALIADAPVMRYLIRERGGKNLLVLPGLIREESYAFAMANGSELQEPVNQAMLTILPTEEWRMILNRYLGQ
ncbi:transporter substrate-binding domain-containing protein [Alcanivorax sp. S6407]|uniref:transporter substrate-binding domain-containing protein n=1 Tax=Alcanivorax sp. S6407 TaxID=2926424 RepID=UPI001FF28498|nr:transporter substrate-binding domain-containing protein [Alcanivorax sp. S6407]MCK0153788.1 transporter substrate-binding domain-containing protein [Alcanivorax sp. S6407]